MSGLSNRLSILRRRGLAYPAGFAPGFDPSHVAAGAGPFFSAIAVSGSGGFINLTNGAAPSGFGGTKPTARIDTIGPVQVTTGIYNEGVKFSGYPASTSYKSMTMAAIIRPTTINQAGNILDTSDQIAGVLGGVGLGHSATGFLQVEPGIGTTKVSSVVQLTANHTYFVAASFLPGTSVPINFISVDLGTGQILTDNTTWTPGAALLINSTIMFGQGNLPKSIKGRTASGMVGIVFLSIPQLLVWAADPWSFWYPSPQSMDMQQLVGTPAVIPPPGLIASGWAETIW
jgi:hypothetical protein